MITVRRALAAVVATTAVWVCGPAVAFADSTPYTDPNSVGLLTLCDSDGAAVTSGSISDKPFVWRAVSAVPAQAPYDQPGRTATLFAYQPREQVWSTEWSGYMLTASANYSNPEHPMAQATRLDGSLSEYLDSFPPQWAGFVQLRLYLGVPQQPAYTSKYATADIQVSGDTWTLVRGGGAGCSSGTASSLERVLHPNRPNPRATHSSESGSAPTGATPGTSPSASAVTQAGERPSGAASASDRQPAQPTIPIVGFVGAALVAASVAALLLIRRRRRGIG